MIPKGRGWRILENTLPIKKKNFIPIFENIFDALGYRSSARL
jgi:hypothetical protein